jgi:hypothetical protein
VDTLRGDKELSDLPFPLTGSLAFRHKSDVISKIEMTRKTNDIDTR